MPSRATHVEARLAELPVGHPRQRENFHRTQVLKPTEMAFPHSPPTRHFGSWYAFLAEALPIEQVWEKVFCRATEKNGIELIFISKI